MIQRLFAILLLAAFLPQACLAGSALQARIAAKQARKARLQAQLHQKRAQLQAATFRVSQLQTQLGRTNAAIAGVNGQLGSLAAQARSAQLRLAWNTKQLAAATRSLALHDRLLRQRLVGIYEYGAVGYLNVLLSARSFSQFVERWQDLRLLIAANEQAIRERKVAAERVAAVQADLERTRLAIAAQQQAQEQARSRLASLAAERSNLVALASQQRRNVAFQVTNMEELTAAQEAQLEVLIRQRQAEIAAQAAQQRRAAGIAGTAAPVRSGLFSWPVTGIITSPFGWRRNPFGGGPEFHPGLDIAAPMGTTVTAAASGVVMMAQAYGGYGNYILIDNGGGFSTGYGHLSAIYVSVGQHVKRGQAIGAVGSTGYSTGPHLHFEIRINGKPVDPAPRLP
ncbi:MAG: murein hydrolase activator EnvC family protein [Vulcanimicrobiaceae bacterium]